MFIGKCNETQFQCRSGECKYDYSTDCKGSCIPSNWLNNGIEDCTDGSDEPLSGNSQIIIPFWI